MDDFYDDSDNNNKSYGLVTRLQLEQILDQAFTSGRPPQLQLTILDTCNSSFAGLDLSGAELADSKWWEANLAHCILVGARLKEVNFTWSVLEDCDFSGAVLMESSLNLAYCNRARFVGAKLLHCSCSGTVFRDARFTGAVFTGSSLCFCEFHGAEMQGAVLTKCDLTGSYFNRADLRHADLRGANLSVTDFSGADLTDCDITGAFQERMSEITIDRQTVCKPGMFSGLRYVLAADRVPLDDLY